MSLRGGAKRIVRAKRPTGISSSPLETRTPDGGTSPPTLEMDQAATAGKAHHLPAPISTNAPNESRAKTSEEHEAGTRYNTRPQRVRNPVRRLIEETAETYISGIDDDGIPGEIFSYQALFPKSEEECIEGLEHPLMAYKAHADPDTMYLHQALKEDDAVEFIKAMLKEVNDQMENGNFEIIKRSKVPFGVMILRAVWQMKRKRDIKTREVKKYKARLNLDGSAMRKGEHYERTYAPVAKWHSIRLLLSLAALHNWRTTQIDFVLAFPQSPVERDDLYMEIPKGFEVDGANDSKEYVLHLKRNVYGQKQAARVWNQYLVQKLVDEVGFTQSETDECLFFKGNVVYLLYTDDSILAGPSQREIDKVIEDIKKAKLDITIEGDLQDFLGVNIDRKKDGTVHLTQPHLVDTILKDLRVDDDNVTLKNIPACSSKILSRHPDSPPFDGHFNFRSVIGKLNYLEKATRPDIAYIVHQCARFTVNPKEEHGKALKWLGRYLKGTRDKGIILRPVKDKGLEVHVDADFCGNWNPDEAEDPATARSRHGYIISYAGCPIQWKSQLQTEVCLSSTESEFTGLSYALREAIPMMHLLNEMKEVGLPVEPDTPKVHCRVFEDNSGALEIAREFKYRARTKHLNVKLHHFRSYVERKEISIHKIDTLQQPADFLTKPLSQELLERHRKTVMGW